MGLGFHHTAVRLPDRFICENPSGAPAAELKNLKKLITSCGVRIFVSGTTEANSCCCITGKRIALTTFSPRILLFYSPFAFKPWVLHFFVAHRSTASNKSISLIDKVSLETTASSKVCSIVVNSSDFTASSDRLSITSQHRSVNSFNLVPRVSLLCLHCR